ncbi:MAG: hypothetical protein AAGC53_01245 [Actinomycetota bacterium]
MAAAMAMQCSRSGAETLLIDLAGDQPELLGVPSPDVGVTDWLGGIDVPLDGLAALELDVAPHLRLLARGGLPADTRLDVLARVCAASSRTVIVDAGVAADVHWAGGCAEEIVVVRACYLAVRRTGTLPSRARLVVIEEPGRALRADDVATAVGVPVWRRLVLDPAVARSVDAGLLSSRLPRSLRTLDPLAS